MSFGLSNMFSTSECGGITVGLQTVFAGPMVNSTMMPRSLAAR